ncbi:MAG: 50S ribosomal protein L21 [Salinarimonas sp.]|nr:50S ribosomal protein L21 [Salinarimonas sp.]
MFAVIKTGGKQYRVAADDVITVERLSVEAGESVTLTDVLMLANGDDVKVGAPVVEGASVVAEVVEQTRGPKVIAFKKRRRQNSKRKRGHRQDLTTLRITEILADGAKPSGKKSTAKKTAAKKAPAKAKAAEAKAADAKAAEADSAGDTAAEQKSA